MKINAYEISTYTCVSGYAITLLDNRSLTQRLKTEAVFAIDQLKRFVLELRSDPIARSAQVLRDFKLIALNLFHHPRMLLSSVAAITIVSTAMLLIILTPPLHSTPHSDLELVKMIDFSSTSSAATTGAGIGAHSTGSVGVARGSGEGSKPEFRKSRGGGASGDHDRLPAQHGKLLPPSEIPAPVVKLPRNPALPRAGIDIDPALWASQSALEFGDPRSASTSASKGPGEGGNFGDGKGFGTGEGEGNGFGPGSKGNTGGGEKDQGGGGPSGSNGNDPDQTVRSIKDVTQRVRIVSKPEPQYTEEARKNQITGTVILRVVFGAAGQVVNIRTVSGLPFGLTERAIAAARQIRFVPATKDNRAVSVYMQLEYNFNLY
jgi:TonB family protein